MAPGPVFGLWFGRCWGFETTFWEGGFLSHAQPSNWRVRVFCLSGTSLKHPVWVTLPAASLPPPYFWLISQDFRMLERLFLLMVWHDILSLFILLFYFYLFIFLRQKLLHSFCCLSYDRFIASSKPISPQNAI
jgi:hypothetical protein